MKFFKFFLIFSCLLVFQNSYIFAKSEKDTYNVRGVISNTKYDRYFLIEKDNKYGVASEYGKLILPCKYCDCIRISKNDNRYIICENFTNSYRKECFIQYYKGEKDTPIFPCEDIQPTGCFDKFLIINRDNRFEIWDKKNNQLYPVKIVDISDKTECHIYLIMRNNFEKYGLVAINPSEKVLKQILPYKYDDIRHLFLDLYAIKNDGKYALFDLKNPTNPVFEYDDWKIKHGDSRLKLYVKKDKKWYYIIDNRNNKFEKKQTVSDIVGNIVLLPVYLLFCDWHLPDYTPKTITIKENNN